MIDVSFNPRTPGPMKVVADMEDSGYYAKRAIECIMEADTARICDEKDMFQKQMTKAMQLLLLAKFNG